MSDIVHRVIRKNAKPRTGRILDALTSTGGSSSGSSASVDLSNLVKKTGEEEQTVDGSLLATGELIAYADGERDLDLPIASKLALGCVIAGDGINIDSDGTISVAGGGGGIDDVNVAGDGNALTNLSVASDGKTLTATKGTTFATSSALSVHTGNSNIHVTSTNKNEWNTAYLYSHTHSNKSLLDVINQGLSTTSDVNFRDINGRNIKASGEVVAYASGNFDVDLPYGSKTSHGALRVGTNLTVSGGVIDWSMPDVVSKPGGCRIGGRDSLYVGVSGGNSLNGYSGSNIGNLYLNYMSSGTNVRIDTSGKIYGNGVQITSDERLKNIGNEVSVLDKLDDVRVFYYTRKDIPNAQTEIGVSAQEIERVFPEIVSTQTTEDLEEFKSVDYSRLATICMQAIKELKKELEDLKNDRKD